MCLSTSAGGFNYKLTIYDETKIGVDDMKSPELSLLRQLPYSKQHSHNHLHDITASDTYK